MDTAQNNSSILTLERDGQLILMNVNYPRPVVIRKGIDYVKSFMKNPVKENDFELYNFLFKHRIIGFDLVPPKIKDDFNTVAKKSLALYMLVTQKCNLSCSYCLAGTKGYRQPKTMSKEIAFLSLDSALSSLQSDGSLEIIFFGGEPLLNWKLIKECLIYIENTLRKKYKDIKMSFNMTSNMTILPTDFVEIAKKYRISILVDVDGPEELHDSARFYINGKPTYSKIKANLKLLADANIPFQMRATIFSGNVACIPDIVKIHKEMGATSSGLPILIPINSDGNILTDQLYPDLNLYSNGIKEVLNNHTYEIFNLFPPNVYAERILKGNFVQHGCGIARGSVAVVTSLGDVYPCIYLVGKSDFYLGNILADSPFSQSNFDSRFRQRYEKLINVNNMDICNNCHNKYLCGGGCPIRILSFLEKVNDENKGQNYFFKANCITAKTSIQETLWYYANLISEDYKDKV